MSSARILKEVEIKRSARVLQLEGMFEVAPAKRSSETWQVDMPIEEREWSIGAIVGPSGSGKSTIAQEMFPGLVRRGYDDWLADAAVIDGFSKSLGIRDITQALSSVGFSSPPAWLRPYRVLSTGQQFRVTVARALTEETPLVVLDEFTSVVDRTVAQVGSAAVAAAVRRSGRQFVAVTCHEDVIEWLQPDWVYSPVGNRFTWRLPQRRPDIELVIRRVTADAWPLFERHHYMNRSLNKAAGCFVAYWRDRPVAFVGVLAFPHVQAPGWRISRSVCLPDYQGVGIGNAFREYVASLYAATGRPVHGVSSNPSILAHCNRSPLWRLTRAPSLNSQKRGPDTEKSFKPSIAARRLTATFAYCGPVNADDARAFGISLQ